MSTSVIELRDLIRWRRWDMKRQRTKISLKKTRRREKCLFLLKRKHGSIPAWTVKMQDFIFLFLSNMINTILLPFNTLISICTVHRINTWGFAEAWKCLIKDSSVSSDYISGLPLTNKVKNRDLSCDSNKPDPHLNKWVDQCISGISWVVALAVIHPKVIKISVQTENTENALNTRMFLK